MADSKITALTALTAADPANDMIPIVDVSDTPPASGNTKRISINNLLACSPSATLASATITGDLTVDTSTLKVDSTNNRVGIGTATPAQPLHVRFDNAGTTTVALFENRLTDFSSSTAGQIAVGSRGYNYTVLRQNPDGGTTPSIGGSLDTVLANISALGAGYGKLILATQNTARLSVHETSGDVSIANGNLVMGTSGKGIDFSAVTGGTGTATANVLNDYEEGTWTPVVADAATGGNVGTCVIGHATYTKIGRQVSIECYISSINTTGMTAGASFIIRGLPFTAVNGGNGNFYTYRVGRNASTVSSSAKAVDGGSSMTFPLYTTNSATTDLSILVSNITSGTSEFVVSVTYFV